MRNMDKEEGQQNMISNLPLLFACGYPTSLEKISETQLENFIPFMVQCSLGHINTQGRVKCGEPEWWPEDVPYIIPFTKPRKFTGNWMEKMKEIVIICYQFHKSIFLLKFCNDLASYEHASLRFINNYNSTTSLFDRRNNKLLVTFRNENMSYDQPQRNRKCLLKQKKNERNNGQQEAQQMMVEPAPFDIYLCDNCDAELYSKEAILEHEKTCIVDADDVILCDTPDPERRENSMDSQADISMNEIMPTSDEENKELRNSFLLNFNLQCNEINTSKSNQTSGNAATTSRTISTPIQDDIVEPALERRRRLTRRNRAVHSLTRCPSIPLSSPAGMLLLRTTMPCTTAEYLNERLERLERFCHAPVITKAINRPKFLEKRYVPNCNNCTFKKPQGYHLHNYVFPRRQYAQRRRAEDFCLLNLSLLRRCRRMTVRIKKIPDHEQLKRATLMKNVCNSSNLSASSSSSSALNIKLKRDTTSSWKISKPTKEVLVDSIDLCSSDDGEENDKPPPAKIKRIMFNQASDFNLNTAEVTITPALTTAFRQQLNSSIRQQCTISSQNNDISMITNMQSILNEKRNNLTITRKSISSCVVNNNNFNNERTKSSINNMLLSTSLPLAAGVPSTSSSSLLLSSTTIKPTGTDVLLQNINLISTGVAPIPPPAPPSAVLSKIANTTNKLTSTMLTKTLPLSKSGHNRQQNNNNNYHLNNNMNNNNNITNNNNNNNNNYNLLSQHFSMKSSELNLSRDVTVKRVSMVGMNHNNNNNTNNNNNSKITPANWLSVNSTINSTTMNNNNNNNQININKNNSNNNKKNNKNNLVATSTHIMNSTNTSTPNLNSVENRVVSIDLTL